jgi:glycosyltransferase involved in cell wall biosynthesis/GNAT superfamily N-acetyltransferase
MKNGLYKNTVNLKDIENHFDSLEHNFIEELKQNIPLNNYFSKIIQNATLYEFWGNDLLVGFAAVYENRGINNPAYLTNISIIKNHTGKGIGSKLLKFVIHELKEKNFSELVLEVKKDNNIAIKLYTKLGFIIDGAKNTDSWFMKLKNMNKKPLVSICMITYNHENLIAQAIEGVVMQKTNFPIELIIGEDCSTDNTRKICLEYKEKFPDIIKLLLPKKNLGMQQNVVATLTACTGKYIALCEGDDYWTDPLKLQRQVDFLEANHDVILSSENGLVKNLTINTSYLFNKETQEHYYTAYELLEYRKFPTASVVFRNKYKEEICSIKYLADTVLWVFLSTKGLVHYNSVASSVYNRGVHGLVEGSDRLQWAKITRNWDKQMIKIIKNSRLKKSFDYTIFSKRNCIEFHSAYSRYFFKKSPVKKVICLLNYIKYRIIYITCKLLNYLIIYLISEKKIRYDQIYKKDY